MYYRKIESIPGFKARHDEQQKAAANDRMRKVKAKQRAKKLAQKEGQA